MKKFLTFATCTVALLAAASSCSSDEELLEAQAAALTSTTAPGIHDRTGEAIDFSLYSINKKEESTTCIYTPTANSRKRLAYNGKDSEGKWKLKWNAGDTLHIFCPEAMTKEGDATYAKTAPYELTEEGEVCHTIQPYTDKALHWGTDDLHTFFYYYYPKGNVELRNYTAGALKRMIFATAILPEEIVEGTTTSTENDEYVGAPTINAVNMQYAPMVGMSRYNKDAEQIDLYARPIFTTVDVYVKASTTDKDSQNDAIYSVDFTSIGDNPIPLAADFYAIYADTDRDNPSATDKVFTTSYEAAGTGESNQVRVTFKEPIVLESGSDQILKVTAFLLPYAEPENLRISINRTKTTSTSTSTVTPVTKTIVSATAADAIKAGKYNHIILGQLPASISYPTFIDEWTANPIEDGEDITAGGEWQHMN